MDLRPLALRDAAAEAVHRAVRTVAGDDGLGHCDLYALAGFALLPAITGLRFVPQVGSFAALVDPPDGWFQIFAENGGLDRREYHCWLGLPGPPTRCLAPGITRCGVCQIVDFSLRHVRAMVARMPQIARVAHQSDAFIAVELAPADDQVRFTRADDFPPYLWVEGEPPADLVYMPDLEAMRAFALTVKPSRLLTDLGKHVHREYAVLARERSLPPP
jgi:hypothetical protein